MGLGFSFLSFSTDNSMNRNDNNHKNKFRIKQSL